MIEVSNALSDVSAPLVSLEDLAADPHGVYRYFRQRVPFIRRSDDMLVVLRAGDVRQLSTDHRVRQTETEFIRSLGVEDGPLFRVFEEGMLTSNGDVHRNRRAPFTRTFSLRLIASLRPMIRAVAEEIIDGWDQAGEIDLLDAFASPLPARVIAAVLGLPAEDVPTFTSLVYSVARILSSQPIPDGPSALQEDTRRLLAYVEEALDRRRREPADDFLTAYLAALEAGDRLSASEGIVQIAILIIGGSDTTRAALASMVNLLLKHGHYGEVCRDPALVPAAVAESLRFEPSVGSIARVTLDSIDLAGGHLSGGRLVSLSNMSAMRDETVFERPDTFDLHRTDQQRLHMVFGGGAHRCLGEGLAKAELEEALAALTRRLPGLELAGSSPTMQGHFGIRWIDPVRVRWASKASRPDSIG
ncbi:MAG: cytochrome P450 [Janthinobacterium lividum]